MSETQNTSPYKGSGRYRMRVQKMQYLRLWGWNRVCDHLGI